MITTESSVKILNTVKAAYSTRLADNMMVSGSKELSKELVL